MKVILLTHYRKHMNKKSTKQKGIQNTSVGVGTNNRNSRPSGRGEFKQTKNLCE